MKSASVQLRGRESIFAGGSGVYRGETQTVCPPSLEECVMVMEDCCEEANETQQLLRSGTRDIERINLVLENERVFMLVDEGTIRRYKSDLAEEIEPAISELIERAEQGLKNLYRKEGVLQGKVENSQSKPRQISGAAGSRKMDNRRLQALSKQKDRLCDELESLEAEVKELELQVLNR